MGLFVRQRGRIAAAIFLAALILPARAQDTPTAGQSDLATAYSQAMAEFQAGNFAKAATELEALVARVEPTPQVEPIFYTIGSAYFNAGDYPKAITAFKNYQAKFPKGPPRRRRRLRNRAIESPEQELQGSRSPDGRA
jgi:outer membrane protein assembly factor BamD (BamD/ComL family)